MCSPRHGRGPFRCIGGSIPRQALTITRSAHAPDRPNSVDEGIICHVFDHQVPETVPLYQWSNGRDHLYTNAAERRGRRPAGYRRRGSLA